MSATLRSGIFLFLQYVQAPQRVLSTIQRVREGRPRDVWSDDPANYSLFHLFRSVLKKEAPAFAEASFYKSSSIRIYKSTDRGRSYQTD